ncbi:MAG: sulfatase-like hydrolase/transferase, partial [Planctomycetes bacterium]|nr:sulfatase-like hydrolase/transferase [Planctomycetota bacterium]
PELPDNFEYDTNEPEGIRRTRMTREGVKGNWTKQHWRYYRWSYYRHIEIVDAEIGRLLDSLDDFGYADDTMIILTSDHGEGMGHHQWVRKSTLYDEGASVPLLISWPKRIGLDKTNSTDLVSGLDIMPTICDYVGIEPPANMRGESLRGILEGKTGLERKFIVSESNSNAGRMVRTKRYKYITYVEESVEQLFDMEKDPGETKNLAGVNRYASALREHRQILHEWESGLDIAPNVPNVEQWRRQLRSRARV